MSAKTVASATYKKPSKKEEVKTFSVDELPRLEPNIKKTETVYSITSGSNPQVASSVTFEGENVEKCIKTITFKSDAKENMLVIFMAKCKKCNLLFDSEDSNLHVKKPENKYVCSTGGSSSSCPSAEKNIERKAFFMEYYYAKYLIHYIDGVDFNNYLIRGCNCIYYVDEEESKVINKYLDKLENVCKFPLIRYKKMLNIIITANRKADRKNSDSACACAEGSSSLCLNAEGSTSGAETPPTPPTTPVSNTVDTIIKDETSAPIVYGGADYIDPPIEDLTESLIDKTKHRNFIKYSTLEERREARLKQRLQLLNNREVCDVCKCDVRYGGTARHLLTAKHIKNMNMSNVSKVSE